EPLLFGTTFLAVALVGVWVMRTSGGPPSPRAAVRRLGETAPPSSGGAGRRRASIGPGCACIAAVLTRYEAFPIVAAAIGLAFVVLWRGGLPGGAGFWGG